MNSTRGEATAIILIALAVVAGATWLLKPSWLPGASRRAANSSKATSSIEKAIEAQGATVAAGVAKIGEANSMAPESPAKTFIGREVPLLASMLPPPNQDALLAAERRRAAMMEGRLEEARKLYENSSKEAERLKRERDEAFEARRAADLALEQAAAAEHAKSVQVFIFGGLALLFLAGWVYAKVFNISPDLVGRMAADIRAGENPIKAIDTYLAPRFHSRVRTASKLATEPAES